MSDIATVTGTRTRDRGDELTASNFEIVVEPDEDRWRAYSPALEHLGAATWGYTRDEALRHAREVVEMVIAELAEDDALRATDVRCSDTHLHVTLRSGQTISTPLWWYPRLLAATPEERAVYEIMLLGVHWPEIDEDLSVVGMLKGTKARMTQS